MAENPLDILRKLRDKRKNPDNAGINININLSLDGKAKTDDGSKNVIPFPSA